MIGQRRPPAPSPAVEVFDAVIDWRAARMAAKELRMKSWLKTGSERRNLRDKAREAAKRARSAQRLVETLGDQHAKRGAR